MFSVGSSLQTEPTKSLNAATDLSQDSPAVARNRSRDIYKAFFT